VTAKLSLSKIVTYLILSLWSLVVLFPIWIMIVNSFKPKRDIFRDPFGFPENFTTAGYQAAWTDGRFDLYFFNTIFVTALSLILVLVLGSLAAYALANWKSRWANLLYIYFIAGLMIPIRLGTINHIQIMKALGLLNSLWSLILVYIAMGLPIATFVLTAFIRNLPSELYDAARIDGASEWRIYSSIIVPLTRPALATVTIFNMITIWNDIWFPLNFVRAEDQRTVSLGVSLLFGQYQTDWNRVLSTLSLAAVPILVLYILMSKQFIKGLTAGAVKG
jgi:raffinose/stachyose/melibiose transport system permease protein